MYPSTSSSSEQLLWSLQSRKLLIRPLLHNSLSPPPQPPVHNPLLPATAQQTPATEPYNPPTNGFDANVVMVLSVLLCALICSLGLNSIIRCALRCSSFVVTEPTDSQNPPNNSSTSTTACSRLANTGIKKKALKTFPTVSYSADMKLPGLDTECVICLSDFASGEKVRLLPKCNHGFHVRCIDKWLNSHSSCPTCRNCLIETCQKIVGCSQASSSEQPPAQALPQETAISLRPPLQPVPQETAVSLAPLEREDPSRNPRTT